MLRIEVVAGAAALALLESIRARKNPLGFTAVAIAAFFVRNAVVLIGLAAFALNALTAL